MRKQWNKSKCHRNFATKEQKCPWESSVLLISSAFPLVPSFLSCLKNTFHALKFFWELCIVDTMVTKPRMCFKTTELFKRRCYRNNLIFTFTSDFITLIIIVNTKPNRHSFQRISFHNYGNILSLFCYPYCCSDKSNNINSWHVYAKDIFLHLH